MSTAIELHEVTKLYRRHAHRRQFATLKSALISGSLVRDLRPDETFTAVGGVSFSVPTGSAFGIGCLIGYAPGMFAYVIYGAILDHFPGQQGYNYVFILMSMLAIAGFMVSSLLYQAVRKKSVLSGGADAVQA